MELQALQARPEEDFAELAVASPGVWDCTGVGGRVKSRSALLAATPPTAVRSLAIFSPPQLASLPPLNSYCLCLHSAVYHFRCSEPL